MVATLRHMGRPKKAEPTTPLRIPESVAKIIRRIALHRGMDPGDYIAERFRAILDEDDAKRMDDERKERAEKKPKK